MSEFDRLLNEGRKLSTKERNQLAAALAYDAKKQTGYNKDSVSREEDSAWQALCKVTKTPMSVRGNMIGKETKGDHRVPQDQWDFAVGMLNEYIDSTCLVPLNVPARQRVMEALFTCLKSMNRSLGKGTSPKELVAAVPNLDDAVDLEFPGYGDAGLLHRLADPVLEAA